MSRLKTQFFPKDLSYLSYVDVWLPEDAPLSRPREIAEQAERSSARSRSRVRRGPSGETASRAVLESLTTFVGGGGPRFWFSVSPELPQLNYAQMIIEVEDKHDTQYLVAPLQDALSRASAGGAHRRAPARERQAGRHPGRGPHLRRGHRRRCARLAEKLRQIFRGSPTPTRVRDDWGAESFTVQAGRRSGSREPRRASRTSTSRSSAVGMNGSGDVASRGRPADPGRARLRVEERAQLSDICRTSTSTSAGHAQQVPLAPGVDASTTGWRRRRSAAQSVPHDHGVGFPVPGVLPSEVLHAAHARARPVVASSLPPGYQLVIGGEDEEQMKGFGELAVVMLACRSPRSSWRSCSSSSSAVKPLIVFAAIPFGVAGALVGAVVMGAPFGFMAFLGSRA